MTGPAALALLLLTPAAPVPAGPPTAADANAEKAAEFGNMVYAAAMKVSTQRRDADLPDLAAGAVRGMYEAAGQAVPDDLLKSLRLAKRHEDRMTVIADARTRLAPAAPLRGVRAHMAALHGFRHAFDPLSGLATLRTGGSVSVEMDFGLGFEFDGVEGQRVTAYRLERQIAAGSLPPTGLFGPPPQPGAIASPASLPWRVRRVVPGSPANSAGLRPGDVITHLNGAEVTAAAADRLFQALADPADGYEPKHGGDGGGRVELRIRRGAAEPLRVEIVPERYTPTNVAGCVLRADGTWDGMLDPVYKIGYLRVGTVEESSARTVGAILSDLAERGCRGLVLDLRWCPGGYVQPGVEIAGLFLAPNAVVARVEFLPNIEGSPAGRLPSVYNAPETGPHYPRLPVAVLVGPETLGGGELLAAALQEGGRAVIVGQRSPGRAATQEQIDLGYGGLQFKATYGMALRPSGKPRHRTPTSTPTDGWGIRPDPGLEVPVTPVVAAQLRVWAEEHALRATGSRETVPFDDPDRDPPRAAALAHLRKRLGPPPAPAQN